MAGVRGRAVSRQEEGLRAQACASARLSVATRSGETLFLQPTHRADISESHLSINGGRFQQPFLAIYEEVIVKR